MAPARRARTSWATSWPRRSGSGTGSGRSSTRPPCCATSDGARLPAPMPPVERFVPRFAAEPPQEELPYGRWEERLAEQFLAAAQEIESPPGDLGEPGTVIWYPDRTWQGMT